MARQRGLIKVKGRIGDVSYYKSQDGWLARETKEFDPKRLKTDPAYARVRENLREFGGAAQSGKLLRDSVAALLFLASDNRVTSRVTKLMTQVKDFHTTAQRGARNVAGGLTNPQAIAMLKGFNFNKDAILNGILLHPYTVDTATGEIALQNFVPINHVAAPGQASYMSLVSCWARIDFVTGTFETLFSDEQFYPIDTTPNDVSLLPNGEPAGAGMDFFFLKIGFQQGTAPDLYPIMNGAYNSLAIVEIV
jgi:hypothetical protein